MKKIFALLALSLVLTGCSSTVSNLTPSRLPRSSTGLYRVEASWRTSERAVRPDTIKPLVVIGFDTYEMRPELVVSNRWEAFVPVPADQKIVHYRYKFDFIRDTIPAPQADSRLSDPYTLLIIDKPGSSK